MKSLLFVLLVVCFINLPAQQPYYDFKKYLEKKKQPLIVDKNVSKLNPFVFNQSLINLKNVIQPQGKLSQTLSNGNKVYILPNDNMICIVPNMQEFNMPNPGRKMPIIGMPPYRMPRFKLIPEEGK